MHKTPVKSDGPSMRDARNSIALANRRELVSRDGVIPGQNESGRACISHIGVDDEPALLSEMNASGRVQARTSYEDD